MDIRHTQRTVQWGNWGITFMDPQPDLTRNYGLIAGFVSFAIGSRGPVDGTIGSPLRNSYRDMCRGWIDRREIPAGFEPQH